MKTTHIYTIGFIPAVIIILMGCSSIKPITQNIINDSVIFWDEGLLSTNGIFNNLLYSELTISDVEIIEVNRGIKIINVNKNIYNKIIYQLKTLQSLYSFGNDAANLITVAELLQLNHPDDMDGILYNDIKKRLDDFVIEKELLFTYYLRPLNNSSMQSIVDNDFSEDSVNLLTPAIECDFLYLILNRKNIIVLSHNFYSGVVSTFVPIIDSKEKVIAVAGVDISDELLINIPSVNFIENYFIDFGNIKYTIKYLDRENSITIIKD
jgi:hypothetical protein